MSDSREPEVTGAPSADARSVEVAEAEAVAGARGPAYFTLSLLWAAPRCLVYRDKISSHWGQGFSSNEGVKEGYPP